MGLTSHVITVVEQKSVTGLNATKCAPEVQTTKDNTVTLKTKRSTTTLLTTIALISLGSSAFATDWHIEGNSCFSTAGPGETQGAEGSGLCGSSGVTCDYAAHTCSISRSAPDRVTDGAAVGKKASASTTNMAQQPSKTEGKTVDNFSLGVAMSF